MATATILMVLLQFASTITTAEAKVVAVDGRSCKGNSVDGCPAQTWHLGLKKHTVKLRPGDQLAFTWTGVVHGLVELPDKPAYDSCAVSSPKTVLSPPAPNGAIGVTVGPVGEIRYFACPVPGHCSQGMGVVLQSVHCVPPRPVRKCTNTKSGKHCSCARRKGR